MLTALFVVDENDAANLIPWGLRFAHANHGDLLVVCAKRSKGPRKWMDIDLSATLQDRPVLQAIQASIQTFPDEWVAPFASEETDAKPNDSVIKTPNHLVKIQVRELSGVAPEADFIACIEELNINMLLVPAHEPSKANAGVVNWEQDLMRQASCETMLIRGRPPAGIDSLSIRVVTTGEDETDIALRRALQLTGQTPKMVSILFISRQPERIWDDPQIEKQIAERQFQRLLQNINVDTREMQKTVVIDDNLSSAIEKNYRANPVDLVIIGTRNFKRIEKLLHATDAGKSGHALAAVRDSEPLVDRIWRDLRTWVRQRVPQLQREGRIRLVEWLQNSTRFDFDFIALISLATLIATLGLIRNSASVVIGAMLVAPLMTPLIGAGFALVQGNQKLVRNAARSLSLGFALAFALAIVTSWFVPDIQFRAEILARAHPDMLDLIVAFLSGIAAAYAMGRPHLVSALPGVVISAALVPPIATSGIALGLWMEGLVFGQTGSEAWERLALSLGAMVLFLTNIVAIILGTAIAFWAVGIDSRVEAKPEDTRHKRKWPRFWFVTFVVLSILLSGMMTWLNGIVREHEKTTPPAAAGDLEPDDVSEDPLDEHS